MIILYTNIYVYISVFSAEILLHMYIITPFISNFCLQNDVFNKKCIFWKIADL